MKIDQLRKIIKEEVRAAVKEELQEMLNEAVKIASQPSETLQQFNSHPAKITEVHKSKPTSTNPIMEMLEQTKASMTSEEYKNIYSGTSDMVQKPNFASMMANNMGMTESKGAHPGLDLTKLDFLKNAGAIYKASEQKDKEKYGVS